MVADEWQAGRALLAGDAAHLMPPFLGQGMCSGLRDARNLAWKFDLVLRGACHASLLDTYEQERKRHSAEVVKASLAVGELIMITDAAAAEQRNARLRESDSAPAGPMPCLTDGVLLRDADGVVAQHAGELSVQPRIRFGGSSGRADDLVGSGWSVLTTGWDAGVELSEQNRGLLQALEAVMVRIEDEEEATAAPGVAVDLGGVFTRWVRAKAGPTAAAVVRPDFYTFGVVAGPVELEAALHQLAAQLGMIIGIPAPGAGPGPSDAADGPS
jgi:hypothetical protein